MMKTRLLSMILILCLMLSCAAVGSFTVSAAPAEISEVSAADYGIPDRCEDGNILHCFNWTLPQIKAELPNIAKAGFTAVQTSPLQPHDGNYQWYWLYQPRSFTIGNELGSYSDLKALCTEADKYNIKIIVDVVANHLAGSNNGSWGGIDNSLRKSEYFHNQGPCNNTDNRNELIYKNIGMPDLNSENIEIQNKVFSMLSNLKNAGVDGIRWDAAKHIGLPSEGCNFWAKMASMAGLYQYGEILDAPAGKSSDAVNDALITEYASYIGVTDEIFSSTITGSLRDKRLSKSKGNWIRRGVSAERVVYWGESHDTYGNDGWTNNLDQNVIDRAYAVVGARADSQSLYLSRPFEKSHTSISYAKKGSTHFTSKEVAAVNHFHNAMVGSPESFYTNSNCYVVCRGGGAVIVSLSGSNLDVSVTNSGGMVPSGTYTDEVSGAAWTVTATTISGRIGSTGIAVVYDKDWKNKKTLIGDADQDGSVTILDATAIQRNLASLPTAVFSEKAADVDEDKSVTILDATAIQRYLANLSTNAPHINQKA